MKLLKGRGRIYLKQMIKPRHQPEFTNVYTVVSDCFPCWFIQGCKGMATVVISSLIVKMNVHNKTQRSMCKIIITNLHFL